MVAEKAKPYKPNRPRVERIYAILRIRERELLKIQGPCSAAGCRLHLKHEGPCDVKVATPATE